MKRIFKIFALGLTLVMVWNLSAPVTTAFAAGKTMNLSQAISYGKQANTDIKQKNLEITLKNIELKQAIQSVKDIRKDKATVRYSLLFNIKFPQKLNLTEEEELTLKAPDIEIEMRDINKEIKDIELQSKNDVTLAFIEVYALQKEVDNNQAQYSQLEKDIAATDAKVRIGKAQREDLDTLKQDQTNLKNSISAGKQKLSSAKTKLSQLVGMDVSGGYSFSDPLSTYMLPRDQLDTAVNFTLENDYNTYLKESAYDSAQGKVELVHGLYKTTFGSKYKPLEGYVNTEDLDYDYYMRLYEDMLVKLDEPWDPVLRLFLIFFVLKIPFEWFKGELDGTRYMKEEKYALPTAMIARDNARMDFKNEKKKTEDSVRNMYDNMAAGYRSYTEAQKGNQSEKSKYDKVLALNKLGKSSLLEVSSQKEVFLQAQQTENDALVEFNNLQVAFDRKTCGFIQAFQAGDVGTATAASGESTAESSYNDSMYYLKDLVPDVTKTFRITLGPEEKATEYELWFDNAKQIGKRTPTTGKIAHVTSSFGGTGTMLVKLFNNGALVKSGTVDPSKASGKIKFYETKEDIAPTAPAGMTNVGSYKLTRLEDDIITEISLNVDPKYGIGYYTVTDGDGKYLISSDKVNVTESFVYISFAAMDTKNLKLQLYDMNQKFIGEASMGTAGSAIMMEPKN